MVALLGLNPLSPQPQQPGGQADPPATTDDGSSQTVQPATETNTQNDTSGSNTNTGGDSNNRQTSSPPPQQATDIAPPSRAEPQSVVEARVYELPPSEAPDNAEALARQAAIDLQQKTRTENLISSIAPASEPAELPPAGPPKDLPDPLPTSPFLKRPG